MFQEILNDFRDEFFSPHSRRCRERLLVLVTQCAAQAMGEKKYLRFFAVVVVFFFQLFLLFAFVAVRKIKLYSIQKESCDGPVYYPGTFV